VHTGTIDGLRAGVQSRLGSCPQRTNERTNERQHHIRADGRSTVFLLSLRRNSMEHHMLVLSELTAKYQWYICQQHTGHKASTTPPPQPFYSPFSETTRVNRCQTRTSGLYGARGGLQRQTHRLSGWCHSIQTNQCPRPPSHHIFLRAGCPFCRPANSVKALKARHKASSSGHTITMSQLRVIDLFSG